VLAVDNGGFCMLNFICHYVEGFEELTQEDQILLIKHGSFPVMLARYTNLVSEKTMFLPLMAFRIPRYFPHVCDCCKIYSKSKLYSVSEK